MKIPKRVPAVLNSYEQLALLKQPNLRAPTGLRNMCIIGLMLKIGLRVSETIKLKIDDVNWQTGSIHINESGAAAERTLWIEDAELSMLKKWVEVRGGNCDYLFSTLDGSPLKDRYIREMVKRLARKAGITKDVYPHLLRYTFAVEFIRETRDINLLQDALGHRDANATQAYSKLLFNELNKGIFSDNSTRRSGMPVKYSQQQQIKLVEDVAAENRQNYQNHISSIESEKKFSCNTERDAPISETGQGKAKQGLNDTPEETAKETVKKEPETSLKPEAESQALNIGLETEEKLIKIPPLKCSNCNYVLRYKIDCPRCGVKFKSIIEHWRRNI